MKARIRFMGAAQTVTGSRHLLQAAGKSILIDCGLFQGELRSRNFEPFPFPASHIDAVLLTHAHIDHSGYLPKLVQLGFRGPIYATPPTAELLKIMLPDSAKVHGEAKPLYSMREALETLPLVRRIRYDKAIRLGRITARFHSAGHILGSTFIEISVEGRKLLFSGDLGRYDLEVGAAPQKAPAADILVMESTHGDTLLSAEHVERDLARIVNTTRGVVLIPAFAVSRTQTVLYHLRKLQRKRRIPKIPIYLDSPLAEKATAIHLKHARDPNIRADLKNGLLRVARPGRIRERCIILTGNGMATGGRVLNYLHRILPDARHTVLFVGFQGEGTRGRALVEGARFVEIDRVSVPVRARIEKMSSLSAHADADDLVRWVKSAPRLPKQIFLTHGEPSAQKKLAQRLRRSLHRAVHIPHHLEWASI